MTIYNIAIDYTTGNSFNTDRNREELVGIVTTDLGLAKANLKRIKNIMKNMSPTKVGMMQDIR